MDEGVWSKADLHIHSAESDGTATVEEILEYVERGTDLALIAITDHDKIKGALAARDLAVGRNYRFGVVVGVEVTTLDGHLLALFVEKPVPMLRSLEKTIAAVHQQGGLCIVPHPMSWLTRSVGRRVLDRVTAGSGNEIYLDGLEVFNPTLAGQVTNREAKLYNGNVGLPELGNSDSHHVGGIGSAYTLFNGRTAADLRKALEERRTRSDGRLWTLEDHREAAGLKIKKYGRFLSRSLQLE